MATQFNIKNTFIGSYHYWSCMCHIMPIIWNNHFTIIYNNIKGNAF